MPVDKSVKTMIDDLVKTIGEVGSKHVLHDEILGKLKDSAEALRSKVTNLEKIESSIDGVRQEILQPVTAQLRPGTRFSKLGFIFGLIGIIVAVGGTVVSNVTSVNYARSQSMMTLNSSAYLETVLDSIMESNQKIEVVLEGINQLSNQRAPEIIPIPKPQASKASGKSVKLYGPGAVLSKATDVMEKAQTYLTVVLDMPAFAGAIDTLAHWFGPTLAKTMARMPATARVLWPQKQSGYVTIGPIAKRDSSDVHTDRIRDSLYFQLRDLVSLHQQIPMYSLWISIVNFWVSEDSTGRYRSVIAFIDQSESPPKVNGIYSESTDVATNLIEFYKSLVSESPPEKRAGLFGKLQNSLE